MLSIKKDQLAAMPAVEFPGRSIIVDTPAKARDAIAYLMRQPIVGFDTETRPSFRKGQNHQVALLQLATSDECFLIRLNIIGMTEPIRQFLESPDVLKVGLSTKDDFHALRRLHEIEPRGFIELQSYVKGFDIADNSLQRIYGIIFGSRISKAQRLTNWEAPELTPAQQRYASIDAWACLRLYSYLKSGAFDKASSPYLVSETPDADNDADKTVADAR